jgi:hypothetical protein
MSYLDRVEAGEHPVEMDMAEPVWKIVNGKNDESTANRVIDFDYRDITGRSAIDFDRPA